jgi:hypothetical protein
MIQVGELKLKKYIKTIGLSYDIQDPGNYMDFVIDKSYFEALKRVATARSHPSPT